MEAIFNYDIIASFVTLSVLEIVLGIDNIIFIALVIQHLPKREKKLARVLGISFALVLRIIILFGLTWILKLTEPLFSIGEQHFTGKDLLLIGGGLFLISKSTSHIHEMFSNEKKEDLKTYAKGLPFTILQVVFIDFVFSFDSVITAVGMTQNVYVIIAATVVSIIYMMFSVNFVSGVIEKYPTIKTLALAFILMIGFLLIAEGFGAHIPRGYVYFAMAFAMFTEGMNIAVSKKKYK